MRATLQSRSFDPRTIPECVLWLDATRARAANGAGVGTLRGRGRGGHIASQGTGANQPLLRQRQFGNRPTLEFDGVNDSLTVPDSATHRFTATQDFSIVMVCDDLASASDDFFLVKVNPGHTSLGFPGSPEGYDIVRSTSDTLLFRLRKAAAVSTITAASIPAGRFVVSCTCDRDSTTGQVIRYDGVSQASGNPTGVGDISTATLDLAIGSVVGGGFHYQGHLAELLIYRTLLTPGQHNRLGRYLSAKWGTPAWTLIA